MIRALTLSISITLALGVAATAARATPPSGGSGSLTIAPPFVDVPLNCGSTAHYRPTYRATNGQWVKGRCVPNRGGAARPGQ